MRLKGGAATRRPAAARKGSDLAAPRSSPSPAPADNASSREAILLAALQAFARDGYDGASMPKIARMANVAPPLIHYYFGSKDKLWRETVDRSLGELHREAAAICAATRALAPLDRLRALLQAYCHFAARYPDHFFMIIAEARSETERFAWVQENFTGILFNDVVAMLRDARASGAIREVEPEQVATILISGILVYFTVYPKQGAGQDLDALADAFCDQMFALLLRGILAP